MAWRIDEQVVRGEIDNRIRGRVTGRIWLLGQTEPVELELAGDCWRDLAGRRLEFSNPQPKPGLPPGFAARQEGAVGDITASRKVKVPEVPMDELMRRYEQRQPFPWHWGNSLYLEWFSRRNGRVVIESADYELKIVGESAWEMTPEEELEQRKANGTAMAGFMDRLADAAEGQPVKDDTPAEWDEKPQTEAEAEAMQARSDLLSDRIQARMEREGKQADFERIMEEEIERLRKERGEPEPTSEQLARNTEWIEEANRAGEEALVNPDPELEAELTFRHPLVDRVMALSEELRREAERKAWRPEFASPEHPVAELLDCTMIAGAKLAGVLNGHVWPPELEFCAHTLVRLNRARGYLDDALRAAQSCLEEELIRLEALTPIITNLAGIVGELDVLIAELRAKLERGTD